jgi:hypothetical protein
MTTKRRVTYEVVGTDRHLPRARTLSDAETVLQVEKAVPQPWLPFGDAWNVCDAYNLCLFSDLTYRKQEADDASERFRVGTPPREPENRGISKIRAGLESGRPQSIDLVSSDIAPGGELPLMTRTVPEGEHFQDLRFWDSNQIGTDREAPSAWKSGKELKWLESALFILALLSATLQLTGCTTADTSSPPKHAPVLQFYGTKSDSVRLMLSIRYVAQSSDMGCESFTTESMSMKPIRSTGFVFSQDPDNVFIPGGDMLDVRVVPFTISNKMGDVISYTWNTSLSWRGRSARCEFAPEKINMRLYNQAGENVGGTSFRDESWPLERGPEPIYEPLSAPVRVDCSRDHNVNRSIRTRLCFAEQGRGTVFKIESEPGDTTRIELNVDV